MIDALRERLRLLIFRYHLWQAERHGKKAEDRADSEREERIAYSTWAWPRKGRKRLK